SERGLAADENIANSRRTTAFMSPKAGMERRFRDAVLKLAADAPFARALVNSGRLSQPFRYPAAHECAAAAGGGLQPGSGCEDAPVVDAGGERSWLLRHLGESATALTFVGAAGDSPDEAAVRATAIPGLRVVPVSLSTPRPAMLTDVDAVACERYGA